MAPTEIKKGGAVNGLKSGLRAPNLDSSGKNETAASGKAGWGQALA